MIHNKFRYLLTLVALFAMTTGAWAQEGTLLVTMTAGETVTYAPATATDVAEITMTGATQLGTWYDYNAYLHYSWLNSSTNVTDKGTLEVTAKPGYTITKVVFSGLDIVGSPGSREVTAYPFAVYPWGEGSVFGSAVYTSDSYTEIIRNTASNDILGIDKIEVYGYAGTPEPPIEVTTNAASEGATFTEASFTMPAFDATVDYEIVRDLAVETTANITVGEGQEAETLEADSHLRIKKTDNGYVFVKALAISFSDELENVTIAKDGFETAKLVPQFYIQQDDEQNPWILVSDDNLDDETGLPNNLQPGQVYCVTFVPGEGSAYDGETPQSFTITLFEGYPVEVAAKEYITYFKDENLYVEDEDAEIYTITDVNGAEATATQLAIAPMNVPILVYNSSEVTRTILLIPTESQADNVTAYLGFIGTLEATTIAASNASTNNYALNGKEFVWVRTAIPVAANKAWLAVPVSSGNSANIRIVFDNDETTEIEEVDSGQLTVDIDDSWYDLSGRKLDGQPTTKGVYIWKGKKVVVR
jgi:hypothetical protein